MQTLYLANVLKDISQISLLYNNTKTKGKSDTILLVNSMSSLTKCLSQKYMSPELILFFKLLSASRYLHNTDKKIIFPLLVKITTSRKKLKYANIFIFCASRYETAWKCTVGSWHDDYSPCCFALTLITWSSYFLYGILATVLPDHSFSMDYG